MPLMQIELDHNSNNNNSGHNLSDIKLLIFIKFIQLPHEVVPIIVPSLQMGKLRLGEERSLAEGHATRRSVAGFGLDRSHCLDPHQDLRPFDIWVCPEATAREVGP